MRPVVGDWLAGCQTEGDSGVWRLRPGPRCSQRALPGSVPPGSGYRREVVARDRAQSPRHIVTLKAVGVGEIALGEKQKTGQGWKIESYISGS